MRVRHEELVDTEIGTRYGLATLDEDGFLIDLENPPEDMADVIKNVPGFLDGDVFRPPPRPKPPEEIEREEAQAKLDEVTNRKKFVLEDYKILIAELLANGAPKNSEGYIDQKFLNEHLRSIRQKVIPGTLRRKLQDELTAQAEGADPKDAEA